MRFSRNWIGQYTSLPESDQDLAEALSSLGLVVDAADPRGDDLSLDLDVASNRPDVMNHLGVARELALLLGNDLRAPEIGDLGDGPATSKIFDLDVQEPGACPRFVACAVVDVDVVPSPSWLVERLESIGLRPINAVVDITNFVMWEMGRPMHAYDLDTLSDHRLIVRRARAGEALVTLDEVERDLTPDDLVIADGRHAVGLAGLMGGEDTGVTGSTRRVLIECAAFDPSTVRAMARRHGMHTDASHRFERGLTTRGPATAALRAANLIAELCGGRIASELVDDLHRATERPVIDLSAERLQGLLGDEVPPKEVERILRGLGFVVEATEEGHRVTAPADRLDVRRPVDVIEEIARFWGYERLPDTLPLLRRARRSGAEPVLRREAKAREICTAAGYWEAMTLVFSSEDEQAPFLPDTALVELSNPLNEAMSRLRGSLLPGLLAVVARNLNVGAERIRLFEIGRVFHEPGEGAPPDERRALALLGAGLAEPSHHEVPPRPYGFADLKAGLEMLAARLGWPDVAWRASEAAGFQPGSTARVTCGPCRGTAGKVDPAVAERFGVERDLWALEIDVDALLRSDLPRVSARPPARYPGSERDVTLLVPEELEYARLEETVQAVDGTPLEGIALADTYRGDDLPAGRLAMTLRLTFRSRERTLTTEEIERALADILDRLESDLGVVRR